MRILLAEDDAELGDAIATYLKRPGHAVDWVHDGVAADAALRAQHFDIVILDLGLPRMPGRTVLEKLRDRREATPVLIITAQDALGDRIAGLDAGADDYLVKPFALAELEARMRALVRRSQGQDRNVVKVAVEPDHPDYAKLMGVPTKASGGGSSGAPAQAAPAYQAPAPQRAPVTGKPSWAQ